MPNRSKSLEDAIIWSGMDPIKLNGIYGKSKHPPNQSQQWCPSDTKELFDQNMANPATAARLAVLGWTESSITYHFNNHGFRTFDDWDIDGAGHGNMFLGCSVTIGIGLNIEDTWAYKVSSMIGGKFYNLAQAGTGIETQYRMLKAWGPILRPARVFTIGSYEPRREFMGDHGHDFMFTPWTDQIENDRISPFIFSETETRISTIRTLDAMKSVVASIGAELWCPRPEDHRASRAVRAGLRSARDLMHVGKDWHIAMASSIKNWVRLV